MKINDILGEISARRSPKPTNPDYHEEIKVQLLDNDVLGIRWGSDPHWVEVRGSNYWQYNANDPLHQLIDKITGNISDLMNGVAIPIFSWYPEYPELMHLLTDQSTITDGLEEALKFNRSSPYGFVGARNTSKNPAFLSQNEPRDLANHNLYLGRNGKVGYAMDQGKDLQNVFNNNRNFKGGRDAMIDAIKNGATTLNCFDGALPIFYKQHGFVVTGRVPFNDEYAPHGWDYNKYGRPDVVFMIYDGGARQTIEQRVGKFSPYQKGEGKYYTSYEAARKAQRAEIMRGQNRWRR
jgi:hypothetical protein